MGERDQPADARPPSQAGPGLPLHPRGVGLRGLRGSESYHAAVSDAPEFIVARSTYVQNPAPRDLTFTFSVHYKGATPQRLESREVERGGDRFFIMTLPGDEVVRFRQNPKSGEAEPVDSIPGGDPE